MNRNIILYICVLFLFSVATFSQKQKEKKADEYFKEFAYKKASRLYEELYSDGYTSEKIISRMAESYYNNSETKKAEKWYAFLIKKYSNKNNKNLFRYAQTLRSNGDYKKSDSIFLVLDNKNILKNSHEYLKSHEYIEGYKAYDRLKVKVVNLKTNTKYSDFGGTINNNEFYYASSRPNKFSKENYKWNDQAFLSIYKSSIKYEISKNKLNRTIDTIYNVGTSKILPQPVNTKYHEALPVFTRDGKTMYFNRLNYDGKVVRTDRESTVNLKIYKAKLQKDGSWGQIEELPFNNNQYSVGHPSLSADERALYFASNMPGGFGGTDIYKVSIREDGGGYGKPENLGEVINTTGDERFPFISSMDVLYFSSNGHLGLGLLDIFKSEYNAESNVFNEPENMHAPFNSDKDDFAFFIARNEKNGFFSSNRDNGKGDDDIYSFMYVKEPDCIEDSLFGVVYNPKTGHLSPGTMVKLFDEDKSYLSSTKTNENGVYNFDELPCKGKYFIKAIFEDFETDFIEVIPDPVARASGKPIQVDINYDEDIIVGNQLKIRPIYFDYNWDAIRPDAAKELDRIVEVMKKYPKMIIRIESHTDCRGDKVYNRVLSDRRAKSTRDYIVFKGVPFERIQSAKGYGEDYLINKCCNNKRLCNEEEHKENRRSYFYIVNNTTNVIVEGQKEAVKGGVGAQSTYMVKENDTLYSISIKYNLTVEQLKDLNGIKSSEVFKGQVLRISK